MSTQMADTGTTAAHARLPADARPGRVRLLVSDLDRSIRFYEDTLGLRSMERTASRAVLGAANADAAIVELETRPGVKRARGGALGLFHVAILLPERAALGRFLRHLVALGSRFGASDHLVSEAIYLSDPDGLGIEVYIDRPRSEWRHDGDEFAMATEPLDFRSVDAAGGGVPWTGAPAGTRVGHVHLSVGSLAPARRFYEGTLGFDVTVAGYPGALFFSAGGYHHHLGTNTWGTGRAPQDDEARLLDWELVVPRDAATVAARVTAGGFPVERSGDSWLAADPWGTRVRLTS